MSQVEDPACAKAETEMWNGFVKLSGRMQGSTSFTPVPLQTVLSGLTLYPPPGDFQRYPAITLCIPGATYSSTLLNCPFMPPVFPPQSSTKK